MAQKSTCFDWTEDLELWDDAVTQRIGEIPLAAVLAGPQPREAAAKASMCEMPPTVEIPMVLLDVEDARTPADWERVSVEMDAVDSLDLLLQSVDTMLEAEAAPQHAKVPIPDVRPRNSRPMTSKPLPYKADSWTPH